MHPIDQAIKDIKPLLVKNFTHKWSQHVHAQAKENCNKIVIMDGNWKLTRLKCAYDNYWRKSDEFKEYRVGCPNTPERLSYFCSEHRSNRLIFRKNDEYIEVLPKDIKITRLSIYMLLFFRISYY